MFTLIIFIYKKELEKMGVQIINNKVISYKKEENGKTISGIVRAPYQSKNLYGGFYFYAQHLVEMVCEIFGRYPISVTAKQNGKQVHVLFHYEDYDCVGVFTDGIYVYYAARMAEKATTGYEIPNDSGWFYREFK